MVSIQPPFPCTLGELLLHYDSPVFSAENRHQPGQRQATSGGEEEVNVSAGDALGVEKWQATGRRELQADAFEILTASQVSFKKQLMDVRENLNQVRALHTLRVWTADETLKVPYKPATTSDHISSVFRRHVVDIAIVFDGAAMRALCCIPQYSESAVPHGEHHTRVLFARVGCAQH